MENKRKSPTKITSEVVEQIRTLVESGAQNKEICERLSIGSTTLTTYKKKYNMKYKKPTAEDHKDEIIRLYSDGMSVKNICELQSLCFETSILPIYPNPHAVFYFSVILLFE